VIGASSAFECSAQFFVSWRSLLALICKIRAAEVSGMRNRPIIPKRDAQNRPDEGASGECTHRICSLNWIPHISKSTPNHREGCRCKESTEEAAEHDSFHVVRNGHGYLKYCKECVAGK
jgi:hypothetical protein